MHRDYDVKSSSICRRIEILNAGVKKYLHITKIAKVLKNLRK